jgi:predicted nuclease of restriction endonuclease-like (RecB) superfamily
MHQSVASYSQLFEEIRDRIEAAQVRTVVAANQQVLLLYWQLWIYILQNQDQKGWGAKIIDRLAIDLSKAFPNIKGFSVRNLKYMRRFAEAYTVPALQYMAEAQLILTADVSKVKQIVTKIDKLPKSHTGLILHRDPSADTEFFLGAIPSMLSWSHHLLLLEKVPKLGKRFWYMLNAVENGVSRTTLAFQIESKLFERQVSCPKITNFRTTLPSPQTDMAQYMLKDPFIFDFVQAKDIANERDIERQLSEHIIKFLIELGQGFALLGRQVHFHAGGRDFYVDLLFYHVKLHAYIVIELKATDFDPCDAGKLNFYINLVNEKFKTPHDNDTIGLLLCKGKNNVVAEYSLRGINQPIGVTEYQLGTAMPTLLKSQLPDVDELLEELKELED